MRKRLFASSARGRQAALAVGLALVFAASADAEEAPPWEFEIEPHERFDFLGPAWFDKGEDGWLFTVKLRSPSFFAIKPVTHLAFEGLVPRDEEEIEASEDKEPYKVGWEKRETVLRRDFDNRLNFVRVFVKGVPDEVEKLVLRFVEEPPPDGGGSDGGGGSDPGGGY